MTQAATKPPAQCVQCDRPFSRSKHGPPRIYCSAACRSKAARQRARDGTDATYSPVEASDCQPPKAMTPGHCPYCGDLMSHPRRKQCGEPECKRLWNRDRNREFQRRYKDEHGTWYTTKATYIGTCLTCGQDWKSRNARTRYCSNACQAAHEYGSDRRPKSKAVRRRAQARAKLAKARTGTSGSAAFIAGSCGSCGTPIVSRRLDARWCSIECKRRQKAARRRARERGAFVEEVSPHKIFERDRWRCQLCRRKVKKDAVPPHPLAPVLDHIIPLATDGTHEPTNVQCAHFLCNSAKREFGGGEQLLLIG